MKIGVDIFQKNQLKKRQNFVDRIHAAFVLETQLSSFYEPTEEEWEWLAWTYPKTKIHRGNDQGAGYVTIDPKF